MKTYERWLTRDHAHTDTDPRRCRVCGHRTVPPVRRHMNRLLLMILGVALVYIALDVVADGRLDGSLYRAIREHIHQTWGARDAPPNPPARRGPAKPGHSAAAVTPTGA